MGKNKRKDYHFTSPEQRIALYNAARKSCNPKDIGAYIHALQDSFSHQRGQYERDPNGGYGPVFGHIGDGHDPDYTWLRPELADQMAQSTYAFLKILAKHCGCCGPITDWELIEQRVKSFNRHYPLPFPIEIFVDDKQCELFPELCSEEQVHTTPDV